MSEKRFIGQMCMDKLLIHFEDRDSEQNIPPIVTIKDMEIVDLLNEQQSIISQLKEENRELRKELNDCEKFRYTVFKRIGDVLDE